jgi:hypothetical protein
MWMFDSEISIIKTYEKLQRDIKLLNAKDEIKEREEKEQKNELKTVVLVMLN